MTSSHLEQLIHFISCLAVGDQNSVDLTRIDKNQQTDGKLHTESR